MGHARLEIACGHWEPDIFRPPGESEHSDISE